MSLALLPDDDNAVVCARGVYRAGCVVGAPRAAVVAPRPVVVAPRPVVVAPRPVAPPRVRVIR
jgi:hypothetical protein